MLSVRTNDHGVAAAGSLGPRRAAATSPPTRPSPSAAAPRVIRPHRRRSGRSPGRRDRRGSVPQHPEQWRLPGHGPGRRPGQLPRRRLQPPLTGRKRPSRKEKTGTCRTQNRSTHSFCPRPHEQNRSFCTDQQATDHPRTVARNRRSGRSRSGTPLRCVMIAGRGYRARSCRYGAGPSRHAWLVTGLMSG